MDEYENLQEKINNIIELLISMDFGYMILKREKYYGEMSKVEHANGICLGIVEALYGDDRKLKKWNRIENMKKRQK